MGFPAITAPVAHVISDFSSFGAEGAAPSPVGDGDLLDQHFLNHTDRLQLLAELLQESLELAAVFRAAFERHNNGPG